MNVFSLNPPPKQSNYKSKVMKMNPNDKKRGGSPFHNFECSNPKHIAFGGISKFRCRETRDGDKDRRTHRDDYEGVYVPPFKLARMMKEFQDKSSEEYQRLTWDTLRKSINGLVNRVSASNIKYIVHELFFENLI